MDTEPYADAITVHKLNILGQTVTSYSARVIERAPRRVALDARWTRPALDLGYVTFETGDRFVEWFYADRWYNVFEIHAADGRLKGWYCNVAEPARITTTEVRCRDLLLDLWVSPDGTTQTLDEEEFAEETHLSTAERELAMRALDELRELVCRRAPPFTTIYASGPDVML